MTDIIIFSLILFVGLIFYSIRTFKNRPSGNDATMKFGKKTTGSSTHKFNQKKENLKKDL